MQICGETKRAYGTKLWGELRMAFFKFVIECIFALFDAVVGNPGLSPEAVQKTISAIVAVSLFTLSGIGTMLFLTKYKEWKTQIEALVIISVGVIVALITFYIAYLITQK